MNISAPIAGSLLCSRTCFGCPRLPTILYFLSSILVFATSSAFTQGPLIPAAGPPAPTMRSLDQIDGKRRPISSLPYTISATGSHYLTANLVFSATAGNAITIIANNVTLDLNGFTLSSTAALMGDAIALPSLRNVTVSNGVLAGNTTGLCCFAGNKFKEERIMS